jgi:chromosome segregation ATPase
MSQQGAPLDVPSHLKDASRERLLAEIGTIQHQFRISEVPELRTEVARLQGVINDLERHINDLTTRLIHSRDYAMGKSAELGELHVHVAELNNQLEDVHTQLKRVRHQLKNTRESTTWRIGRLVMLPVRLAKRVLRRG